MKRKDITGQRFGRLIALKRGYRCNRRKRTFWLCKCDCGKFKVAQIECLTGGKTKSCGCLKREFSRENCKRIAKKYPNKPKNPDLSIIGKKFNYLTVLRFGFVKIDKPPNSLYNKRIYYFLCRCDCGKLKCVDQYKIKGKNTSCTKSCGSCKYTRKDKGSWYKNIVNQKFGKLTVLEKTKLRSENGTIVWKCKCSCGTIKNISGKHLRNGSTKSCGKCVKHRYYEDITGKRFGKLVAVQVLERGKKNQHAKWFFKCDCGNFKTLPVNSVKHKGTFSCGCLRKELWKNKKGKTKQEINKMHKQNKAKLELTNYGLDWEEATKIVQEAQQLSI